MNHVIAYDISVGTYLYFDAVIASRVCGPQVVNVITLDETIGNPASIAVAPQVHAFTCRRATRVQSGVVDVISSKDHRVRVSAI